MRRSLAFASILFVYAGLQATALPIADEATIALEGRGLPIVRLLVTGAKALAKRKSVPKAAPKVAPKGQPVSPKPPVSAAKPRGGSGAKASKSAPKATKPSKPSRAPRVKKGKKFKASDFKASSDTYRNAAAKSKNSVHRVKNGKLVKSKPNGKVQKGLHADHIVEGQTVARAANNAKRKPNAAAVRDAKKVVNDPDNLSFVEETINLKKGRSATAAGRGQPVTPDKHVQQYLKSTKRAGESVADKLNAVFKEHGSDADVKKEYQKVLKANKVKRELDPLDIVLEELV
ncbi:hypothetical protein FA15DRAFT_669588 [Coprinopsis marcescibilis]|uniref:Uncharacterized protein n=1 Tax=Coprinopsis marcescibilis TaxID=230819 RepID=A0A5C3KXD2_COPMA|nr:hypothetical protein FA15DRAFT_669588 [Coprinopsis marcescibilis]